MDVPDRIPSVDGSSESAKEPATDEVYDLLNEYVLVPPNKELPVGRAS